MTCWTASPRNNWTAAPTADANSIGWLIWHLTRVQDDHVAAAGGLTQVYLSQGWADRFGLPLHQTDIGYGHDTAQVAQCARRAACWRLSRRHL